MKQMLGKLILLVPLLIVILLAAGGISKRAKAEEATRRIQNLPDMEMADLNGGIFRTSWIKSGPVLITFFHPECDHCKYEISSLLNCDSCNKRLIMLLVSNADRPAIQSFIKESGISDAENVHILHDPDFTMSELFDADIYPSNYIYNESLELVKTFKGSVRPETIMKYLDGIN